MLSFAHKYIASLSDVDQWRSCDDQFL